LTAWAATEVKKKIGKIASVAAAAGFWWICHVILHLVGEEANIPERDNPAIVSLRSLSWLIERWLVLCYVDHRHVVPRLKIAG
jgi:hypothetical protein